MRKAVSCFGLLAALACQGPVFAADAQCGLTRVAELKTDASHGALLIKVKIEGRDAAMLVDTGSPISTVSRRLVNALKLTPVNSAQGLMDAAGKSMNQMVKVHELDLNGMKAIDTHFLVMDEGGADSGVDGSFGADVLANYDVELDLAHGKMILFLQDHCEGQVVYWTQDFTSLPFGLDASQHLIFDATLDGHPLRAMLDTGTGGSILAAQTARHVFDLDPAGDGTKPDGGLTASSGATISYYRHKFTDLNIAGVDFRNTELFIMPDRLGQQEKHQRNALLEYIPSQINQDTQLIVGLHHLAKLRVYIAYREREVYFSAADAN